ncbi:hypothetical protein B0A49_13766 [Cryomyces minteri]|uniref:Uncharacterized protein n=1 Tax=Cryomyces minteri TaxID=331657 RepID=A0A4U0VW81_9PEZI|nr:hypothetical protein B0A49_13766 [Cryomyces minteri]
MATLSDNLYHVLRTTIDYHHDPSGASQQTTVDGTYTDLAAAKETAKNILFTEGYKKEWFTTLDILTESEAWTHGDGNIVYARTPEVQRKESIELYHVLQETIYYSKDRSGATRDTEIQGTFRSYDAAREAAATCLLDEEITKEDYDKFDKLDDNKLDDWPFGRDVLSHAVGRNRDEFLVSVVRKH